METTKKLIVFTFALFILTDCEMERAVEKGEVTNTASVVTEEEVKDQTNEVLQVTDVAGESGTLNDKETMVLEESDKKALNRSLSNALMQAVRDYGILSDAAIIFNDDDVTGVVYAELIDLDTDGQNELYVLSKTVADKSAVQEDDETIFDNFYTHEIWRAAPTHATRVFFKQVNTHYEFCESCGADVAFAKQADGTWRLFFGKYEFFNDGARFTREVYPLVGEEMQPSVHVLEISDADGDHFSIDGEPVPEETYRDYYSREIKYIIENVTGLMNFAFDGADYNYGKTNSSATVVSHVFTQLNDGINTLAQTGKVADANALKSPMEQLADVQLVASYDATLHTAMLHNLLNAHIYLMTESDIIDAPIADEYGYLPFSEQLVFEQFERRYGVPFAGEDIGLLEPSFETSSYTTYADGIFYVRVNELATPGTIHDIDAAYEIGPNTYYIESTMRDFDWLNHQASLTYELGMEDESWTVFHEEPIDTWPFELRHFTRTGLKRYTIFQLNGEEMELRYYHYVPLSDAELEEYK